MQVRNYIKFLFFTAFTFKWWNYVLPEQIQEMFYWLFRRNIFISVRLRFILIFVNKSTSQQKVCLFLSRIFQISTDRQMFQKLEWNNFAFNIMPTWQNTLKTYLISKLIRKTKVVVGSTAAYNVRSLEHLRSQM